MARQAQAAIVLLLGAALVLGACGRKGPLDPPGGAPQEAPAGTPNPEPKPDAATTDQPQTLKRPTPMPTAKPEAAKTAP